MEDLKSLEESIRVMYTARDKKTNHLRFESRALTLSEAAEFMKERINPTKDEYDWSIKIL